MRTWRSLRARRRPACAGPGAHVDLQRLLGRTDVSRQVKVQRPALLRRGPAGRGTAGPPLDGLVAHHDVVRHRDRVRATVAAPIRSQHARCARRRRGRSRWAPCPGCTRPPTGADSVSATRCRSPAAALRFLAAGSCEGSIADATRSVTRGRYGATPGRDLGRRRPAPSRSAMLRGPRPLRGPRGLPGVVGDTVSDEPDLSIVGDAGSPGQAGRWYLRTRHRRSPSGLDHDHRPGGGPP